MVVLERAQSATRGLEFVHIEFQFSSVSVSEGSSTKAVFVGVTDFHAPDRQHSRMEVNVETGAQVSTSLVEEFWIGNTQYLKNGENGHWLAIIDPPPRAPGTHNPLEGMMIDPRNFGSLSLEEVVLEGESLYRIGATIPSGAEPEFPDGDRVRQVEYWVTPDDFFIRKFAYSWGNAPDGEGLTSTMLLSNFNKQVEITPPDVTPVRLSPQSP